MACSGPIVSVSHKTKGQKTSRQKAPLLSHGEEIHRADLQQQPEHGHTPDGERGGGRLGGRVGGVEGSNGAEREEEAPPQQQTQQQVPRLVNLRPHAATSSHAVWLASEPR